MVKQKKNNHLQVHSETRLTARESFIQGHRNQENSWELLSEIFFTTSLIIKINKTTKNYTTTYSGNSADFLKVKHSSVGAQQCGATGHGQQEDRTSRGPRQLPRYQREEQPFHQDLAARSLGVPRSCASELQPQSLGGLIAEATPDQPQLWEQTQPLLQSWEAPT